MTESRLRLRAIIESNRAVVVIALVVLALAGGWLVYDAYNGTESTEQQVVGEWEVTGTFDHSSTVAIDNSSLYEQGTTLENRDVYSLEHSSALDGVYSFGFEAPDSGSVSGDVELVVQTRSAERTYGAEPEDTTVYWEREETITTRSFESVGGGETVDVRFELDMDALKHDIEDINEEFGNPVTEDEVRVVAVVSLDGSVGGDPIATTEEHTLLLTVGSSTFGVEEVSAESDVQSITETVPAESGPSMTRLLIGSLLFVGSISGLVVVTYLFETNQLAPSDAERDWLAYRDARAEYDEWVSSVTLDGTSSSTVQATADTLEDLVNIAIDTGNPVIEDSADGNYYVMTGEYRYVYSPPENPFNPASISDDPTPDEDTGDGNTVELTRPP